VPIPKDPSDWPDYKISFLSQALSRGYIKILTGVQQQVLPPLPLPDNPTSTQLRVHSKSQTEFENFERHCNQCWADLIIITGFGKPHGSAKYKSIIRAQNVFEAPLASIRNVWLAICNTNENLAAQVQRKEPLVKIMELKWIETDDPSEDLATYVQELTRLADISAQQGSVVPENFKLIQLRSKIPSKYTNEVVAISLQGGNTFETFLPLLKQAIATRQVIEPTKSAAEGKKMNEEGEKASVKALVAGMQKAIAALEIPDDMQALFTSTIAKTSNKFNGKGGGNKKQWDKSKGNKGNRNSKHPPKKNKKTKSTSPCHTCGQMGHWKGDPQCPGAQAKSYHQMHVATSQQMQPQGNGMTMQATAGGGVMQQQYQVPVQQQSMFAAPSQAMPSFQANFASMAPNAPHNTPRGFDYSRHSNPTALMLNVGLSCAKLAAAATIAASVKHFFIVDSGATASCCKVREAFSSLLPDRSPITVANGSISYTEGVGVVGSLDNIYYTPGIGYNLLSVSHLNDTGYTVSMDGTHC
jgi:hypothetical protein